MAILAATDIKDRLIGPVVTEDTDYLDMADDALIDVAAELGVDSADVETTTPHFRVIAWMRAWVCYIVCKDCVGLQPQKLTEQGISEDPYAAKLKLFEIDLNDKREALTAEIIMNEADEPGEMSGSGIRLFRA